jgi:voltage-gated potassium channel
LSIAKTDEEIEKLKRLGANEVLSPTKLIAKRMTAIAVDPDVKNILEEFVYSIDTPLDMEEITVSKKSWVVYKKIKDLHLKELLNVSIIGVKEENGKFIPIPKDNVILKPGDVLLVVGTSKDMRKMRKLIRSKEKPKELDFI